MSAAKATHTTAYKYYIITQTGGSGRLFHYVIETKKRGGVFRVPFKYLARPPFFWGMYLRKCGASRPVARVNLWLPQSSVFRVRVA